MKTLAGFGEHGMMELLTATHAGMTTAEFEAIVRAHRWRHKLESGEYSSSAELAKAEKVNDSYLSRILRLTLIAPDIIEASRREGRHRCYR